MFFLSLFKKRTALLRYNLHSIKFAFFKCTIQWVFLVYSELYNHYHNQLQNIFITRKGNFIPISSHYSTLFPCLLQTFYINGVVQQRAFCDWRGLLCLMFSRFVHVQHLSALCPFILAEKYSFVWVFHFLLIHSVVRHLDYFYFLATYIMLL